MPGKGKTENYESLDVYGGKTVAERGERERLCRRKKRVMRQCGSKFYAGLGRGAD